MSRPVLLHIGLPKTGTTSLQHHLWARHPDVCLLGKPLLAQDPRQRSLITAILRLERLEYAQALPELRDDLLPALLDRPGRSVVLSEEELSTGTLGARVCRLTIADRLAELFPGARVLIGLREPVGAALSLAVQLQSVGALPAGLSIERFLEERLALPEMASGLHALRVDELFGLYADRFGASAITVIDQADLSSQPEATVRAICAAASIDGDQGWACFSGAPRLNPSPAVSLSPALSAALRARLGPAHDRLRARLGRTLETP